MGKLKNIFRRTRDPQQRIQERNINAHAAAPAAAAPPVLGNANPNPNAGIHDFRPAQQSPYPVGEYQGPPSREQLARLASTPFVSTADATEFPAPDGTKVTTDFNGPPLHLHPVLQWGEYTYWPLSYIDNRYCMAIVITDSARKIIKTIQASGARYIRNIEVHNATLEVGFIGQADRVATVQWTHLFISPTDNQRPPLTNADSDEPLPPASSPADNQRPPLTNADSNISPPPAIPMITVDEALTSYFSPPRTKYTNENFDDIARLLNRSESSKYSMSPRLYTLLRHLGCLRDLDCLLEQPNGLSDSSLPLSQTQLPADFSEGWKLRFRDAQSLVCDSSGVEQMIRMRKHMTFHKTPNFFYSTKFFGTGGRGEVDEVFYTLGDAPRCARKRIPRPAMSTANAATAAAFLNEVDCMKRIAHRHCVELVASYSDPSVFAILMLPSAKCNLAKYLEDAVKSPDMQTFLPQFFGCLSRGLWHMHRQQLRHRDIKPENILILDNKVFLADFDCSYNWSHTLHSTTQAVPPRTKEYASPEVARSGFVEHPKIDSSSDIWSLGCVFLEIITTFSGRSVRDLDTLRKSCYCNNIKEIHQWTEELREIDTQPSVNAVLDLIQGMLLENPESRPKAHKLVLKTSDFCCFECRIEDGSHLIT